MKVSDRITEIINHPNELPSLPTTVSKILQALDDEHSDHDSITKLVVQDPIISARILSVANSPLYLTEQAINGIGDAVSRVGLQELRRIVLLEGLKETFPRSETFNYDAFWTHSLSVALFAEDILNHAVKLAPDVKRKMKESLFTAGLLHDIGIALFQTIDEEYIISVLKETWDQGLELEEYERSQLGISHTDAGCLLCERWDLPPLIAAVAQFHHCPELAPEGLHKTAAQIVHIADFASMQEGIGDYGDKAPEGFSDRAWEDLGLEVTEIPELIERAHEIEASIPAYIK